MLSICVRFCFSMEKKKKGKEEKRKRKKKEKREEKNEQLQIKWVAWKLFAVSLFGPLSEVFASFATRFAIVV